LSVDESSVARTCLYTSSLSSRGRARNGGKVWCCDSDGTGSLSCPRPRSSEADASTDEDAVVAEMALRARFLGTGVSSVVMVLATGLAACVSSLRLERLSGGGVMAVIVQSSMRWHRKCTHGSIHILTARQGVVEMLQAAARQP
jgi:hypothetical protein